MEAMNEHDDEKDVICCYGYDDDIDDYADYEMPSGLTEVEYDAMCWKIDTRNVVFSAHRNEYIQIDEIFEVSSKSSAATTITD
jgi:hypothetical protein